MWITSEVRGEGQWEGGLPMLLLPQGAGRSVKILGCSTRPTRGAVTACGAQAPTMRYHALICRVYLERFGF